METINLTIRKKDLPVTINTLVGLPLFTQKDMNILKGKVSIPGGITFQRVNENTATLHIEGEEYIIYHLFLQ